MRVPKSQLTAEQPSPIKIQTFQKRNSTIKDKIEVTVRQEDESFHDTIKSQTLHVDEPQTQK